MSPRALFPRYHQPTGSLTRREREVAGFVARGLTNREISVRLSISERTAGNHVLEHPQKTGPSFADPDRRLGHGKSAAHARTKIEIHGIPPSSRVFGQL